MNRRQLEKRILLMLIFYKSLKFKFLIINKNYLENTARKEKRIN